MTFERSLRGMPVPYQSADSFARGQTPVIPSDPRSNNTWPPDVSTGRAQRQATEPRPDVRWASPLFCQRFLHRVRFELHVGVHLLEPGVLGLQLLDAFEHRRIHAAVLAAPLVKRRSTDAILAADVRHFQPGVLLLEDGHNLRFTELADSHRKAP